jgi:isopenicillin N synthase-like dioxygenase
MRVGRDVPVDDPRYGTYLYGANRWPDLPNEAFKNPVMDYRGHILRLALEVMKILASGLPYSDDVFDEFISDPVGSVKMLHYPPRSADGPKIGGEHPYHSRALCLEIDQSDTAFTAGAHTDFGAITLLLQHPGQEGLEVLHPTTDTWIPVPTRENTFVVNIADVLGAWTNGLYRSATHRVINNSTTDRYSVPFFFDGTMATKMSP